MSDIGDLYSKYGIDSGKDNSLSETAENHEVNKADADYQMEQAKKDSSVWDDIKGTAQEIGNRALVTGKGALGAIGKLPTYTKQVAANAIEGGHPYDDTDSFLDQWRQEGNEQSKKDAAAPDRDAAGLIGETSKTWDTVAQSMPYSALVKVPMYAGALLAPETGGASIIGSKAAQAAGMATMFQASKGQYVSDTLDKFIENHKAANKGQEPTREQILAEQERLQPLANEYAAHEVGWEALGDKLGAKALGLGKALPANSIAKQFLATKTGKAVGFLGSQAVTELPSETETQIWQHNVDVKAGYADKNDNKLREWSSLEDQTKSFNEVKDAVLAQSLLMGGGVHLGTMAKALFAAPTVTPTVQPPPVITPDQTAQREQRYADQQTQWQPPSDETVADVIGGKQTIGELRAKAQDPSKFNADELHNNPVITGLNPTIEGTNETAHDLYTRLIGEGYKDAEDIVREAIKPVAERVPLPEPLQDDTKQVVESHKAAKGHIEAASAANQRVTEITSQMHSNMIDSSVPIADRILANNKLQKELNLLSKSIPGIESNAKKLNDDKAAIEQAAGKKYISTRGSYEGAKNAISESIAKNKDLTASDFNIEHQSVNGKSQYTVTQKLNATPVVNTETPEQKQQKIDDALKQKAESDKKIKKVKSLIERNKKLKEKTANTEKKQEIQQRIDNLESERATHEVTKTEADKVINEKTTPPLSESTTPPAKDSSETGEIPEGTVAPDVVSAAGEQDNQTPEKAGLGVGDDVVIDGYRNQTGKITAITESGDIVVKFTSGNSVTIAKAQSRAVRKLDLSMFDEEETTNGESANQAETPAASEEIKVGDSVFLRDGTTGKVEKIIGKVARVIDQAGTGHTLKLSDLKANKSVFDRAKRDSNAEKTALQSTATGDEIQAEKTNIDAKGLKTFSESDAVKALDISEEKAKATDELLELWSQASINKKQAELEESAYLKKLDSLANQPDSGVTSVINENGTVTYEVIDDVGFVGSFTRGKSSAVLEQEQRGEYNAIHQEALKAGVGHFEVDRYKMTVQPLKDVVVDKLQESATAKAESLNPTELIISAKEAKQQFNYFKGVIDRLRALFHELFRTVNKANFAQDDKISYSFVNADRSVMFILAKGRGDFVWNENLTNEQQALKESFEARIDDLTRTLHEGKLSTEALSRNKGITSDVTELVQGNEILSQLFDNGDILKNKVDFSGFAASTEGGVGAVKKIVPPKPKIDSDKTKPPHDAKLPSGLSGAKPNYSYGAKQFKLDFESDLDKASYITAKHENRSSRDADYVDFVKNLTGWHEDFVRAHGRVIRSAIKEMAKNGEHGETLFIAKQPIKTSSEITGGVIKPKIDPGNGEISEVVTRLGTRAETRFKVVSIDDIIMSNDEYGNPTEGYPTEILQIRPRTAAESVIWVEDTAAKLESRDMEDSANAGHGAPIVGQDGFVESGNGRSMALREAYSRDNEQSKAYKEWIIKKAPYFGLGAKDIEGIENPILIRVRTTPMDDAQRKQFADEANRDASAALNDSIIAKRDAGEIERNTDLDLLARQAVNIDISAQAAGERALRSFDLFTQTRGAKKASEQTKKTTGQTEVKPEKDLSNISLDDFYVYLDSIARQFKGSNVNFDFFKGDKELIMPTEFKYNGNTYSVIIDGAWKAKGIVVQKTNDAKAAEIMAKPSFNGLTDTVASAQTELLSIKSPKLKSADFKKIAKAILDDIQSQPTVVIESSKNIEQQLLDEIKSRVKLGTFDVFKKNKNGTRSLRSSGIKKAETAEITTSEWDKIPDSLKSISDDGEIVYIDDKPIIALIVSSLRDDSANPEQGYQNLRDLEIKEFDDANEKERKRLADDYMELEERQKGMTDEQLYIRELLLLKEILGKKPSQQEYSNWINQQTIDFKKETGEEIPHLKTGRDEYFEKRFLFIKSRADILTNPTKSEVLQRQEEQAAIAKKEAADKAKAEAKRKADLEIDTLADEMLGTGGTANSDIFASKAKVTQNTHTRESLTEAFKAQLDSKFFSGWVSRLFATGKFEIQALVQAQSNYPTLNLAGVQAFYDAKTDKTVFIADNIDKNKNLVGLALHEIGTHALELGKTSKEFQALIENLVRSSFRPAVKDAIDTALKSFGLKAIPKQGQPIDSITREQVLHEVAAYLVENHPQLSITQKIIQWFRNSIRALGKALPPMQRMQWFKDVAAINESDIISMATSALRGAPEALNKPTKTTATYAEKQALVDSIKRKLSGQNLNLELVPDFATFDWTKTPIVAGKTLLNRAVGVHHQAKDDTSYVYLNANLLQNTDQIAGTFAHEVIGHHGLRKLLGKDYEMYLTRLLRSKEFQSDILDLVSRWDTYLTTWYEKRDKTGKLVNDINKIAKDQKILWEVKRKINGKEVKSKEWIPREVAMRLADEYVAETAKILYKEPAFQSAIHTRKFEAINKVLDMVKFWLRKNFGDDFKNINKQDLAYMIARSADNVFARKEGTAVKETTDVLPVAGEPVLQYMFAGEKAQNADKSALASAVEMEQHETIRKETGWFLEQPDTLQIFKDLDSRTPANIRNKALQDVLSNPNADRIMYINDNIVDILAKLEGVGGFEIKC